MKRRARIQTPRFSYLDVLRGGAVGDGRADDTAAIQRVLDEAARRGGAAVYFPAGAYRTTWRLCVHGYGVRLFGDVGLDNHAFEDHATLGTRQPAVIVADHDNGALVLSDERPWGNVTVEHLALRRDTFRSGNPLARTGAGVSVRAVRGAPFCSRLRLDDVAISRFSTGVQFARVLTTEAQIAGHVRITNCNIEMNRRGIWCLDDARINSLHIRDSYVRHNHEGISVAGTSVSICDNVLEGQSNPLRVGGVEPLGASSYNVRIEGNYFEASTGDYALRCFRVKDLQLGTNRISRSAMAEPVQLVGCTMFEPV